MAISSGRTELQSPDAVVKQMSKDKETEGGEYATLRVQPMEKLEIMVFWECKAKGAASSEDEDETILEEV